MACIRYKHQTRARVGHVGERRIQHWRCNSNQATFCEAPKRPPRDATTSNPRATLRASQCLIRGFSVRSTARLTNLKTQSCGRLSFGRKRPTLYFIQEGVLSNVSQPVDGYLRGNSESCSLRQERAGPFQTPDSSDRREHPHVRLHQPLSLIHI